jgi:hypothetical protein
MPRAGCRWFVLALALVAAPVLAGQEDGDKQGERWPNAQRIAKCDPAASSNGPLICGDQQLEKLDERLQRLRQRAQQQGAPLTVPGPDWESARDNCADVDCLRKVYREGLQVVRMELLQSTKDRFSSGRFGGDEDADEDEAGEEAQSPPGDPASAPEIAPESVPLAPAVAPPAGPAPTPRPVPTVLPAPVNDPLARLLPLLVLLTALLAGAAVWWRTRR